MNALFYVLAGIGLSVSFFFSRENTLLALKKAWKSFENILPQLLPIFLLLGIMLTLITPEQISRYLGAESGWFGILLAALLGSIAMIPPFVAFPMAAVLLNNGAGYMQLTAFLTTLTMIGLITFPLEMKYFGRKPTLLRNGLAFLFSFVAALLVGVLL